MPIDNTKIPHRFSRAAFLRYAHIISSVLESWPALTFVDPSPLRVDSFKQPLRDALSGAARYGWKHPKVDHTKLSRLFTQIIVADADDGILMIGTNEAVHEWRSSKTALKAIGGVVRFQQPPPSEYEVEFGQLHNLLPILNHGGIKPLPNFIVRSSMDLNQLTSYPNLAFEPVEGRPGVWQII